MPIEGTENPLPFLPSAAHLQKCGANYQVSNSDFSEVPHRRVLDTTSLFGLEDVVHDRGPEGGACDLGPLGSPGHLLSAHFHQGDTPGLKGDFRRILPREVLPRHFVGLGLGLRLLSAVVGQTPDRTWARTRPRPGYGLV